MKFQELIILFLGILFCSPLAAQFNRLNVSSTNSINEIVEQFRTDNNVVGASVGIVKDGEIVFLSGYGQDDLDPTSDATECTMYRVASIAKTFTAVATLQLIEEGKLDYEDDIRAYVPEYPVKSQGPIKVIHLLQHSSCIDNGSSSDLPYINANASFDATEAVARFSDEALLNPCFLGGVSGNYSNWGFNLLGLVVERAAGYPYEQLIQERIVKPLNMPLFQPEYYWRAPYPNQSEGYNSSQNLVNSPTGNFIMHLPSGGFICTVIDLTLFAKGLIDNDLFENEATRNAMFSLDGLPYGFKNVAGFSYSLGMRSEIRNSQRYYFHNGDIPESSTIIYFSAELEDAVAIMINRSAIGQGAMVPIARSLIDLVPGLVVNSPGLYDETNIPADNMLTLSGVENGNLVEVARNITAGDYIINATANVKLDGERIVLEDGFRAVPGSYFLAHLGNVNTGCSEQ